MSSVEGRRGLVTSVSTMLSDSIASFSSEEISESDSGIFTPSVALSGIEYFLIYDGITGIDQHTHTTPSYG